MSEEMAEVRKVNETNVRLDHALKELERSSPVERDRAMFSEILRKLNEAKSLDSSLRFNFPKGLQHELFDHIMPTLQDPDILTLDRQQQALEWLEATYASQMSNPVVPPALSAIRNELSWIAGLRIGINSVIGD